MAATSEIEKDIEELEKLESEAQRSRVKDLLKLEIRRLQTELGKREKQKESESAEQAAVKTASTSRTQVYKELLKTYAWDQSDKFVKLYVDLKGVQALEKGAVTSQFTNRSVQLEVKGLDGRNCELQIARLGEQIDPEGSYHKVKNDMVLVMLKKKQVGKTWPYVTEKEKLAKEMKKPPPPPADNNDDPSASLMSMLKNMYEEGDDELKRSLEKAVYESQCKRTSTL